MEKELIKNEKSRANFIEILDKIMLEDPKDWVKYYNGTKYEKELQRKYSFSDRSRYYLSKEEINASIDKLFTNIDSSNIPLGMIKQYFKKDYLKIRNNNDFKKAKNLVKLNIKDVINDYDYAIR